MQKDTNENNPLQNLFKIDELWKVDYLRNMFIFLPFKKRATLSQVCKGWKIISSEDKVWQKDFEEAEIVKHLTPENKDRPLKKLFLDFKEPVTYYMSHWYSNNKSIQKETVLLNGRIFDSKADALKDLKDTMDVMEQKGKKYKYYLSVIKMSYEDCYKYKIFYYREPAPMEKLLVEKGYMKFIPHYKCLKMDCWVHLEKIIHVVHSDRIHGENDNFSFKDGVTVPQEVENFDMTNDTPIGINISMKK